MKRTTSLPCLSSPRRVVVSWYCSIGVTFLVGGLIINLRPSLASVTVGVGVCLNVAMAIAIGIVFGERDAYRPLPIAVFVSAAITVLGVDELIVISDRFRYDLLADALPFDLPALAVASIGMIILVGIGLTIGNALRCLELRSVCVRRMTASVGLVFG
jgi:hypothetical protein